jgi:hypothetical protein
MKQLVLIAHNLRSSHNIGSLLRTAEGLGVGKIWLTGYSPYPQSENDSRLPHISRRVGSQIAKTALGAEESVEWVHCEDIDKVIADLKGDDFCSGTGPGIDSLARIQGSAKGSSDCRARSRGHRTRNISSLRPDRGNSYEGQKRVI